MITRIGTLIKKAVIWAALFASIYGLIGIFAFAKQGIFGRITSPKAKMAALIPAIALIVFITRPLENFFTRAMDKYFKKKYDYRELLKTFANEVLTVLDLDRLRTLTVNKISEIIKPSNCTLLLFNKDKDEYLMAASHGVKNKDIILSATSALAMALKQTKNYLVPGRQAENELEQPFKGAINEDADRLKAELVMPLVLHDDMIGILSMGRKKRGRSYTREEIDILMTLVRTLTIAVSNALLFEELSETQAEAAQKEKMAVIGTISSGINHEICNPLGIARGQCEAFLLNIRDGLYKEKSTDDLLAKAEAIMEKVIHETDRATAITKRLSSFARPAKAAHYEDVEIKKELESVLELVGYELPMDRISLIVEVPDNLPHVLADKKQLQEVFFNLIRNAVQAMGDKGALAVRTRRGEAKKIIIEVEDTGHGIPEDNLKRIFDPFYTTKEPGKGTGLGLFIVRQIIERNKGRISVKSKVGQGTTFIIELPQAEKAGVRA